MKKIMAWLLSGVMLIATMPMAMAAQTFTNLKAFAEYLNTQGIPLGISPVEAPVEIKVKRGNEAEQDHLSYTRTGSAVTVDFVAYLDLESVKSAFDNYMTLAETAINTYGGDSKADLLEELGNTKVNGQFTVTVTAPGNVTLPELTNTTDVYFTGEAYNDIFEENTAARTQNGNIITFTVDVDGNREAGWATRDELAESLLKDLKLICNGIVIPDVAGTYEFKGVFRGTTDVYSGSDKLTTISYSSADETADSLGVNYADIATVTVTEQTSGGPSGSSSKGYLEISNTVDAPEGVVDDDYAITYDIMKNEDGTMVNVKSVTLKPGEKERVSLDPGTYYIFQNDENIDGYLLKVTCDDADSIVEIKRGSTTEIEFENVYTLKSSILEKDDHFAYIIGYPDGKVHPEANITRAEVATIFFRMMTDEAREEYRMKTNSFSDVDENAWFNNAISTLQNAKIINGYPDGTFRPNAPITRAELSKIAASFYATQAETDVVFSDIAGHWAEKYIESAHGYGFIDGYPDGTFKPDKLITRAETMKIVNRALERMPHEDYLLDDMKKWPDNADVSAWYYEDVQEATNSHHYEKNDTHEIWTELRDNRDWKALEKTDW